MSTPAPPRTPGALHAAQQQLDELDALIQRMLTLPANPAEEPAPAPEAPTPAPEAATPASSTPTETPNQSVEIGAIESRPAVESPRAAPPPVRRAPPPPPPPEPEPEPQVELLPPPLLDPLEVEFRPVPLVEDAALDGEDDLLPPAEPFHQAPSPLQAEQGGAVEEDVEHEPEHAAAPVSTMTYPAGRRGPLIRANQAFDRLTYPFGPAGYWLRSPVGRDVLGWVGLLLITGSVAWALLDWLGWTW